MIVKELEDDLSKLWIDKDGILYSIFKKEIEINVPICKQIIALRHEISAGEKQYWLYDFNNLKSMPSEGKAYADKYGQDFLHATAALVHNHLQKYIVNIFIAIKKPHVPFRAFTNRQEAKNWLLKHKKANESKSN
jgi:hypothetical protein